MRPSQPKEVPGSSSHTDTLPVRRGCDCVFKKQFQGPIVELDGILMSEEDRVCDCVFKKQFQGPIVELDGILMDEEDPCLLKPSVNTISSIRNICLPKY